MNLSDIHFFLFKLPSIHEIIKIYAKPSNSEKSPILQKMNLVSALRKPKILHVLIHSLKI